MVIAIAFAVTMLGEVHVSLESCCIAAFGELFENLQRGLSGLAGSVQQRVWQACVIKQPFACCSVMPICLPTYLLNVLAVCLELSEIDRVKACSDEYGWARIAQEGVRLGLIAMPDRYRACVQRDAEGLQELDGEQTPGPSRPCSVWLVWLGGCKHGRLD
jgi:hypothetical protein